MTDDYKYNTNRYTPNNNNPNNNNPNNTGNSMYGNLNSGGYGVTRYSNYAPGYFERRGRDRGRGGPRNRGMGSNRGMSSTRAGAPNYRGMGSTRGSTRGGPSYRGSSYRDSGNQTVNRGRGRGGGTGGNEFSIRTRERGSGPDLSGGWSRRMKNTRPMSFRVTREDVMGSGNGNNISNNEDIRRENIIRQQNIMRPQSNIINNNSMRMEQNNNQFNQPINNIQNNNSNTMNMDNNNYTDNENIELKRRPKIDRKKAILRPRNLDSNVPPARFISKNGLDNKKSTNNISLNTEIKNESQDPEDVVSPYNRLSPRNLKILRQQKIERHRKKRILDGLNKVNLPNMGLLQEYKVPIITDRPDNRKKGPEVVRDLKKYVKSRKKVFGLEDPEPMEVQVVPPPIIPRKENNEVDVIKLAQIGGILDKDNPDEFMIETLLEVQRMVAAEGYYDPKIPEPEYPYWSNKSAYYNSYYFENDERYDMDPQTIGIRIRPTKHEKKYQGLNVYNSSPLLPLFTELPQHFYNAYPPYMFF